MTVAHKNEEKTNIYKSMQGTTSVASMAGFGGLSVGVILLVAYVFVRISSVGVQRYNECKQFFLASIAISLIAAFLDGLMSLANSYVWSPSPIIVILVDTIFSFLFLIPAFLDILIQWFQLRPEIPKTFDD